MLILMNAHVHNYKSAPSDIVPFAELCHRLLLRSLRLISLSLSLLASHVDKTSVRSDWAKRPEGSPSTHKRVQRDFLECSPVRQRQDSVGENGGGESVTLANGTQVGRTGIAVLGLGGAAGEEDDSLLLLQEALDVRGHGLFRDGDRAMVDGNANGACEGSGESGSLREVFMTAKMVRDKRIPSTHREQIRGQGVLCCCN
jgi:hypothetical protein